MSPRTTADETAPSPTESPGAAPSPTLAQAPDPEAAKAAFQTVLPRLRAIPQAEVKGSRADMQDAAVFALGVARKLAQAGLRPRFAALPSDIFDIVHFDLLETVAAAAWHAQVLLDSAAATTSDARVPLSVLQASVEVKERMMKVAEYHLAHRSERLAREIADIRAGSGYTDLASDLSRLRKLYVEERAILPQHGDDPHYRPEDAEAAGRLSSAIVAELAAARTQAQQEAQDLAARAWTLLVTTYDEVADAGRLILRNEGGRELFQSLYTAGRNAARRRPPKPPAPTAA